MNKIHNIETVKFESGNLVLTVDGQTLVRERSELSPCLASASEEALNHFEIAPSGYGIHWPDCDEDLSVDALLGVLHQAPMIAAEEGLDYKTNNG